jgi:hypothetical protein
MTILIGIGDQVVEATAEMLAELEATRKTHKDAEAKRDADLASNAANKATLLNKLGITEDEAKLLLG